MGSAVVTKTLLPYGFHKLVGNRWLKAIVAPYSRYKFVVGPQFRCQCSSTPVCCTVWFLACGYFYNMLTLSGIFCIRTRVHGQATRFVLFDTSKTLFAESLSPTPYRMSAKWYMFSNFSIAQSLICKQDDRQAFLNSCCRFPTPTTSMKLSTFFISQVYYNGSSRNRVG